MLIYSQHFNQLIYWDNKNENKQRPTCDRWAGEKHHHYHHHHHQRRAHVIRHDVVDTTRTYGDWQSVQNTTNWLNRFTNSTLRLLLLQLQRVTSHSRQLRLSLSLADDDWRQLSRDVQVDCTSRDSWLISLVFPRLWLFTIVLQFRLCDTTMPSGIWSECCINIRTNSLQYAEYDGVVAQW